MRTRRFASIAAALLAFALIATACGVHHNIWQTQVSVDHPYAYDCSFLHNHGTRVNPTGADVEEDGDYVWATIKPWGNPEVALADCVNFQFCLGWVDSIIGNRQICPVLQPEDLPYTMTFLASPGATVTAVDTHATWIFEDYLGNNVYRGPCYHHDGNGVNANTPGCGDGHPI